MGIKTALKWRQKQGRYYKDQIDKAMSDRSEVIERRKEVRDLYYRQPGGFEVEDDQPWEGAVDIHAPVIAEKVETAVPKTVSAMWRAHPFVTVKSAGGKVDNPALKNVEIFAGWAFRNDIEDFYPTFEDWVRDMLVDGTSFLKILWDRKFRRAIDPFIIKKMYKEGEMAMGGEAVDQPRQKQEAEILAEVLGFGDLSNGLISFESNKKKGGYDVKFTEMGRVYDGFVTIEESDVIDELIVRNHRMVVEYDAPSIENVEFDDLLVPARSKNIKKAKWVAHKTWYSMREIRKMVRDKVWTLSEDELVHLENYATANDSDSQLAAQKDKIQGESVNTGSELVQEPKDPKKGFDPNRVMVWEMYVRDYSDGQDEPVDVIHYILDDTQTIAGTVYHDDVLPHGKRPFAMIKYIPVPGRFYGWGMADLLYGINQEVNHTLSLVHNLTELISNPFFFYTPYAAASNDKMLHGVKPGTGIPTIDPNGVKFMQFSQQPLQLLHASFNTLLGYGDRLTFSPSVGGSSNYRNAPRTAKGTMALMNAAEEHLSSIVEQMQETGWKTVVSQVLSLYGLFVATDKWFHVTGETQPRRLNPRDLRNNLQYSFTGSLTSVNRDVQRQLARERYLTARDDPLYQSDPKARRKLLENFLRFFSEGTNYEEEVPALPGEGGYSHAPMAQDMEIEAMIMGVRIDVLPIDDHQGHMNDIDKFIASEAANAVPSVTIAMIAEHKNAHQAALQQVAAQQARMAQMSTGGMGEPGGPTQGPGEDPAPQPGAPAPGLPADGGEMSFGEGGPVA